MSVSGKDGTTFGGVPLNPAWFISRTSGTMPTGGNYSAGVHFSRLGTGFVGFGGIQYLLYFTDGTHVAKVYVDNGTHNFTLDVDGTPLVGSNCDLTTQHHVAVSIGGTTAELIVDGTSQGTITVSAFGSLTQLRVGAQDDGFDADKADGDFTGAIFYSRALTAAQWNTQRNTSIAPVSTTNIFAYLRLASAAGGTADLSGNGFDFVSNGLGDGLSEPSFGITATVASTVPWFAAAASATEGLTASVAAVVAPFSSAGAALETIAGTGAGGVSSFAAAASASESTSATASAAASTFAGAGSAALSVDGTGVSVLPALAAAATGAESLPASGSAVLSAYAAAADGALALIAGVAAAIPPFAAAGASDQPPSVVADIATVAPPFAASGSAVERLLAAIAARIPGFAGAATLTRPPSQSLGSGSTSVMGPRSSTHIDR